jgi:AcrR family transcriptional regulator
MIDTAIRAFAESGYQGARVEDMAAEMGIAKGSFFQYFESKEGLFLAAYRKAVGMLPSYFDAPDEVLEEGFFATMRYWLERTEHLVAEDWIPYRIALIGNYGTDLRLKRQINRFLAEDPYGTKMFVRFGVDRGEVRADIDEGFIVSMVDWLMERFQDASVTQELDPGLFHQAGEEPARRQERIEQFLEIMRGAIGAPGGA